MYTKKMFIGNILNPRVNFHFKKNTETLFLQMLLNKNFQAINSFHVKVDAKFNFRK